MVYAGARRAAHPLPHRVRSAGRIGCSGRRGSGHPGRRDAAARGHTRCAGDDRTVGHDGCTLNASGPQICGPDDCCSGRAALLTPPGEPRRTWRAECGPAAPGAAVRTACSLLYRAHASRIARRVGVRVITSDYGRQPHTHLLPERCPSGARSAAQPVVGKQAACVATTVATWAERGTAPPCDCSFTWAHVGSS